MRRHPVERGDRGGQGELSGEHHRGDDLGELPHLALADAAEDLQALALGGEAGAAAVGGDDKRGDGNRDVEVPLRRHLSVDHPGRRLRDVRHVLTRRDEHRRDGVRRVAAVVVGAGDGRASLTMDYEDPHRQEGQTGCRWRWRLGITRPPLVQPLPTMLKSNRVSILVDAYRLASIGRQSYLSARRAREPIVETQNQDASALISLVLRLAAFSLFIANAIGKFLGGPAGLLAYFDHLFHSSWLPTVVVAATAYSAPYLEAVIGIWLLLGMRLRVAWLVAALYMVVLAFGMVVAQQYDTAAHNYLYVALFCAGLHFSSSDRWHFGAQGDMA